jgi:hypothetical protein
MGSNLPLQSGSVNGRDRCFPGFPRKNDALLPTGGTVAELRLEQVVGGPGLANDGIGERYWGQLQSGAGLLPPLLPRNAIAPVGCLRT